MVCWWIFLGAEPFSHRLSVTATSLLFGGVGLVGFMSGLGGGGEVGKAGDAIAGGNGMSGP